jgi:hypothetical protein
MWQIVEGACHIFRVHDPVRKEEEKNAHRLDAVGHKQTGDFIAPY